MAADQTIRFAREIRLRRRGHPEQMLRVLQDHAGWYYVLRLAGTQDFGPYLLEEITGAFDVDPEPLSVHELCQGPSNGESGADPPHPEDHPL